MYASFNDISFLQLLAAFALGGVLSAYLYRRSGTYKLRHIPTAGYSWPLLSYISAIRFAISGDNILEEYHCRYGGKPFKIPMIHSWMIVFSSGSEALDDIAKLTAADASLDAAIDSDLKLSYSLGPANNPHDIVNLVNHLHRNLASVIPSIQDEIENSFLDTLSSSHVEGWKTYQARDLANQVISRISNRLIVGKKLCRNKELTDACVTFTWDVKLFSLLTNIVVPSIFWPLLRYIVRGPLYSVKFVAALIEPLRKSIIDDIHGEVHHESLFKEMIRRSILDGKDMAAEDYARRILNLNFAAIFTTSMTLQQLMYNLAAFATYIPELRSEVEEIVAQDGWSRPSLDKMVKLDSFIKETQRLMPLSTVTTNRKMLRDYTFSDGTFIPKGTHIVHQVSSVNLHEETYPDPRTFNPFRFCNSKLDDSTNRNDMVGLSRKLLAFGTGRHACPGRFIAAVELKLVIALLILKYDIRSPLGNGMGGRPKDMLIEGTGRIPNPNGEILLRCRRE